MVIRRAGSVLLAAAVVCPVAACAERTQAAPASDEDAGAGPAADPADFEELEEEFGARLGVYALDTGSGAEIAFDADERFAYASTFKVLACGAVMDDRSLEGMEEVVTFEREDLVEHSPVTEKNVDTGMTLMEVCDAAIRYSDNTAANLLLAELGGPGALQEALREIGDDTTIASRWETDLNEAAPGDDRDTTTPRAFASDLDEYLLGDVLGDAERAELRTLMLNNTTGDDLIRAGVPEGWDVADKTGASGYGGRHDIGVLWPPERDPIVLAVYSSKDDEDAETDDALIARATELVVDTLEE